MLDKINRIKELKQLIQEEKKKQTPDKKLIHGYNREIAELGLYINNNAVLSNIKFI